MIRVYRYGLLRPTKNASLVLQQMRLAHEYRNTLVEIERGRRAAIRECVSTTGDVQDLQAAHVAADMARKQMADAMQAIKDERASSRGRTETDHQREEAKLSREAYRTFLGNLSQCRKARLRDPEVRARMERINEMAASIRRDARAICGVYWGTYLIIEASDEQARKQPLWDGIDGNDPSFVPQIRRRRMVRSDQFEGQGQIGVQIQKGMGLESLFGEDSRIHVDRPSDDAFFAERWCVRHKAQRTVLRIRVGSEGRDPIWAEFPMMFHRAMPDDAVIKRVNVSRRIYGPREEWSAEFTVETSSPSRDRCGQKGVVAVDLGWAASDPGIVVARWSDDAGESGELVLPDALISRYRKSEELRGLRDDKFDLARKALAAIVGRYVRTPQWLRDETKEIERWRSPERLMRLMWRWQANPPAPGDAVLSAALRDVELWAKQDHHLLHWESGLRRNSIRQRRDVYRCFAKQIGSRYQTVLLEDIDLRSVARRGPVEGEAENETSRHHRFIVSPSELRQCIANKFGEDVVKMPAGMTPQEMIKQYLSAQANESTANTKGPAETKWARVKRIKRERAVAAE